MHSVQDQAPSRCYIVDTDKSFYEASTDLIPVAQRLGFTVLKTHALCDAQYHKDLAFDDDCLVCEVDNERLTEKLLSLDMRAGLVLPCRVTVYTDNGNTRIGLIRPVALLAALFGEGTVSRAAQELEEKLILMIDEAR